MTFPSFFMIAFIETVKHEIHVPWMTELPDPAA